MADLNGKKTEHAVRFVREFSESGKPLAVICHAPWMLVEADVARGRRLTSFWSIKTDEAALLDVDGTLMFG
jgi:protease I